MFSGFYLAFMLLLFALIFRAVSIEFRSKMQSAAWRRAWDTGFSAQACWRVSVRRRGGKRHDRHAAGQRGVFIGSFSIC